MPVAARNDNGSTVEQIRLRDHAPRGEELVHRQHEAALAPDVGQRAVDRPLRTPGEADPQVLRVAEGVERELLARQRVVAPHHADVARLVQACVAQCGVRALCHHRGDHLAEVADRQIGLAMLQQRPRVARAPAAARACWPRLPALDRAHQRRRQQRGRRVRHRDTKVRPHRCAGRSWPAPARAAAPRARRAPAATAPATCGVGFMPKARAHEQRFTERVVQPLQRMAGRRLRHRQHARPRASGCPRPSRRRTRAAG